LPRFLRTFSCTKVLPRFSCVEVPQSVTEFLLECVRERCKPQFLKTVSVKNQSLLKHNLSYKTVSDEKTVSVKHNALFCDFVSTWSAIGAIGQRQGASRGFLRPAFYETCFLRGNSNVEGAAFANYFQQGPTFRETHFQQDLLFLRVWPLLRPTYFQ
jgi:hypothetical protein